MNLQTMKVFSASLVLTVFPRLMAEPNCVAGTTFVDGPGVENNLVTTQGCRCDSGYFNTSSVIVMEYNESDTSIDALDMVCNSSGSAYADYGNNVYGDYILDASVCDSPKSGFKCVKCVQCSDTSMSPTTPTPTRKPTFPTRSPTITRVTYSPTLLSDKCLDAEVLRWSTEQLQFDNDFSSCSINSGCASDTFRDLPLQARDCYQDCFAKTENRTVGLKNEPYSRECAYCVGSFAQCLLQQCDSCISRTFSAYCTTCSRMKCEVNFKVCTGGMVMPEVVKDEGVQSVLTTDQIILIAVGLSVALAIVGLLSFIRVIRSRGSKQTNLNHVGPDSDGLKYDL